MATIKKREGKSGVSYLIRSSCGYDTSGRHIEKSMTWRPTPGMTPRQVEKELNRQAVLFDEQCAANGTVSGNIKFQTFAEQWFKEYAEANLRPQTVSRMRQLKGRIYTAIGHIRLDRLTAKHIQSFIDNLGEDGISDKNTTAAPKVLLPPLLAEAGITQKELAVSSGISCTTMSGLCHGKNVSVRTAEAVAGALGRPVKDIFVIHKGDGHISPKTIRHYASFISSALDYAFRLGMILDNPCRRVILPAIPSSERECLSLGEAQAFLDSLENAPIRYHAFFVLAIYSGLRRSELLGLEWQDIDFEGQLISVHRTSQYLQDRGTYVDDTKTAKSHRWLKLPPAVFEILRKLKTEQTLDRIRSGDQWHDSQRLFTGPFGAPMHPNTPYHWLSRFCEETGQRFLGIHAFRHLNASLLITAGADVRTVSAALGHSKPSTTLNIYAHAFAESQARASDAVDDLLCNKPRSAV